jgi:hypothetical protein
MPNEEIIALWIEDQDKNYKLKPIFKNFTKLKEHQEWKDIYFKIKNIFMNNYN